MEHVGSKSKSRDVRLIVSRYGHDMLLYLLLLGASVLLLVDIVRCINIISIFAIFFNSICFLLCWSTRSRMVLRKFNSFSCSSSSTKTGGCWRGGKCEVLGYVRQKISNFLIVTLIYIYCCVKILLKIANIPSFLQFVSKYLEK